MYILGVHRATSAPDFIQNGDAYLTYHSNVESDIERLQCHPGKSGGHVFWCLQLILLQNVSNL